MYKFKIRCLAFVLVIFSVNSPLLAFCMTLQEALKSAYDTNDELKLQRIEFLTQIQAFPTAVTRFLPDITMQFSGNKAKNKTKSTPGAPYNSYDTRSHNNILSINQNIFGDGSIPNLKATQSAIRAYIAEYYFKEQQIILKMIQTYLDYYEWQEKYKIAQIMLDNSKTQLDAVSIRLHVGEATDTDLATAQAGYANSQTEKINAYANLQSARASFLKTFELEPENITLPEMPNNLPNSFDEFYQLSLQHNPALISAKDQVQAANARVLVAQSALLPKVALQITTTDAFYKARPQASASQPSRAKATQSAINITVPILSKGGADYVQIRSSKYQARTAVVGLDNAMKKDYADATNFWEGFLAAKSNITSTEEGVKSAQISYNGTMEGERVGTKSILEVLQAQDQLNKAKRSHVDAEKAYILSGMQIFALLGQWIPGVLGIENLTAFNPTLELKNAKLRIL
ncbi:MAG: TolC family protein [Rickettsiaceae bacterium]